MMILKNSNLKIQLSRCINLFCKLNFCNQIHSKFENAVRSLNSIKQEPTSEIKLKLYGLYKQATVGNASSEKIPSSFNIIAYSKYKAWANFQDMNKEEAKASYVKLVETLSKANTNSTLGNINTSEKVDISNSYTTLADVAFPFQNKNNKLNIIGDLITVSTSDNNITTLKFNREYRGNSFNFDMWQSYLSCFQYINNDSLSRVIVITGGSKTFSTGMDLSVFETLQKISSNELCEGRKREALGRVIKYFQDCISCPELCRVPVITAISGNCWGGALDLITACDLRFCTEDASFCVKETDLAMVADIGTLQRLPNLIGEQRAKLLAFTGNQISGREAEKIGLVAKCFLNYEEMMIYVNQTAEIISSKSPITIRYFILNTFVFKNFINYY